MRKPWGAAFTAYVWTTGVAGDPNYVQNVTSVEDDAPVVSLTNGGNYQDWLDGGTYPILDVVAGSGDPIPIYPLARGGIDTSIPNQVGIISTDSPQLYNKPDPALFAEDISRMDMTFHAKLYTVWRFSDRSLYTLATVDWSVLFKASKVGGVLTPDASAGVFAQTFVRTNEDPVAVLLPSYNSSFKFFQWA